MNMKRKRARPEPGRWLPPGINGTVVYAALGCTIAFSVLWAILSFWGEFATALAALQKRVGYTMPGFYDVSRQSFYPFPLAIGIAVAAAVGNYKYFYTGSRSIYVMRRLKSPLELHRRSLALPLAAIVCLVLLCLGLFWAFYGIYMELTPAKHLVPGQLEPYRELWRSMINVGT